MCGFRSASLLSLALAIAAPARAVELTTSFTASGGADLRCRAVNVGTKPANVLVELVDQTGANVATLRFPGCDGVSPLAPNQLCSAVVAGPVSAYCRITTSSKRVRGALTVEDQTSNEVLLAVTAQK
jgi:hypothetical protein